VRQRRGVEPADDWIGAGDILWNRKLPAPDAAGNSDLFSPVAVQHSSRRIFFWAKGGSELGELRHLDFQAGGSVLMNDLTEAGGSVSLYWRDPLAQERLVGEPLLPPEPLNKPSVIFSGRIGMHLDVDPWRRVALPLSLEAGISPDQTLQFRSGYGVRVRFTDRLYAGLYPFNVTYTVTPWAPENWRGRWAFPHRLELGCYLP
jgi:hypothetical protein